MKLVKVVLRDCADATPLQDQGDLALPLLGLAEAYNGMRKKSYPLLPEIEETSTGAQLKHALAKMRVHDKVAVLHIYRDSLRTMQRINTQPAAEESADSESTAVESITTRLEALEAEERIRVRGLARRLMLYAVAPIPPFLVGGVVILAAVKGYMPDSTMVKTFMETVTAILKLILTT